MSINLNEFEEKVAPLSTAYREKRKELEDLQLQFEKLVNQISVVNILPDDVDPFSDEYSAAEEKNEEELQEITDTVADRAYDFDLEWDGSFYEGENSFWQPSNC